MLSDEQLARYERDGYLIVPDFFSLDTARSLKAAADVLQRSLDLSTHPRTIFRTADTNSSTTRFTQLSLAEEAAEASGKYFLDSADRVSFFFEEGAFDKEGQLQVDQAASINKIGHALHVQDPAFADFSINPRILSLTAQLGFISPILLQSMLIFKHPRIGGLVSKHRDSTFLYTAPSSAVGFWFALEDCTRANGTLSFVKGSHKDGASTRRLRRTGQRTRTINNVRREERTSAEGVGAPWNDKVKLEFTGEDSKVDVYPDEEWVLEEVKAGSLVIIHGSVVHASGHNHSDKSRYIYTFHCIEDEGTEYSEDNWLQSAKPFTQLKDAVQAMQGRDNAQQPVQ